MTSTLDFQNLPTITPTGAPVVQTITDNYAFARAVLTALGPTYVTDNNVNNFVKWMTFEEPATNWFRNNNPLNVVTNGTDAASSTYPSLNAAVQGTAGVINQANMAGIKNALASNSSYSDFAAAVNNSPWGTSISGPVNNVPVVNYSGQTLVNANDQTNQGTKKHTAGTCDPNKYAINGPLGIHLLNQCNAKALTGGLLVGVGATVMGFGIIVVVAWGLANTRVGKVATQAATSGPTGQVIKGVGRVAQRGLESTGTAGLERRQAARDEEMFEQYERDKPEIQARNKRYRAEQKKAERAGYPKVA